MSLLATALLLTSSAHAINYKWWGFGPTLGTNIIPIRYPSVMPSAALSSAGEDEIDRVGGDFDIGARINMYPSQWGRLEARTDLDFGTSAYFRWQLTLGYDVVLAGDSGLQALGGISLGIGTERFNDRNDQAGLVADDYMKLLYFPLRADISALLRDGKRAYELGFYTQLHIPGGGSYCTAVECVSAYDSEGAGDTARNIASYFTTWDFLGVNATVWFGDFKNDKKKDDGDGDGKKKKKDKKDKKGSGGSKSTGGSKN